MVLKSMSLSLSAVYETGCQTDVLEHMISGQIKAHELERLLPFGLEDRVARCCSS